jgi:hypothetical protein
MAASRGQIELCRFLLQESGFFHDDEILHTAFNEHMRHVEWGQGELSKKRQSVEDLYRLFVSENSMDVDFRDGHPYGFDTWPVSILRNWKLLLTVSSLRDILNGQSVDFDSLPFEYRFSTAMESTGWPAEIFLSIFRHDNPVSLVTAVDDRGSTALHWAAAHLGAWMMRALELEWRGDCFDMVESYQRLVIKLIRMGANLHALDRPKYMRADPFVSFLESLGNRLSDQKSVASAVRLWGQTITESGHSLKDYANTENRYLADLRHLCFCNNGQNFFPVSIAVNDDSVLQVELVNVQYIKVWRAWPIETPGAWPVRLDLPDVITWSPAEEDVEDGFRWTRTRSLELKSTPRFVELAERSDVAHLVKEDFREARAKWFNGVQDDHGPLALMAAQNLKSNSNAYRQHVQRRSASAPPPGSLEHVVEFKRDRQTRGGASGSQVVTSISKCPFDGRWGACGTLRSLSERRWRSCMRGDHHKTPEVRTDTAYPCPWDWYCTWEHSFLFDDDHDTGTAERFAQRFRPERLPIVQATMRRAKERRALNLEEEVHKRRQ